MVKVSIIIATIVAVVSFVAGSAAKSFIEDVTAKRDAQISAICSPREQFPLKKQKYREANMHLPKEIRIKLLEEGKSFRKWCQEKGFNFHTAFAVATGIIQAKRKGTKSYQIKKAIEKELLGGD